MTCGRLDLVNAPTLRDLLQQAMDKRAQAALPIDYRAVEQAVKDEEKARPRGLALNRTTISQILKGTYKKVPEDGTIRAIGWLAGVPDEVAFTAAGHRPQGPPFATELPQGINDLSPTERRAALEMLRVLVAQRQVINRYEAILASHQTAPPGTSDEAPQDQEVTPPREGGALLDFTPPDVDDLGVAAQKGTSLGRRLRDAQDQDAEDLDEPEDDSP
ncbi:hypothetical protein DORI_48 [Mycobacterium phage Dori]|uniref:hypothetical protein n=1 Tax=Mycobacterium phage Dori TaxID=1089121 RepID=UPI000232F507|nr:hypothetical protein DORI_48 [Mycobacterium phage Dori]AER47697.1 hypothetical protein DORI_48 [Mycobacterium phage Dori]